MGFWSFKKKAKVQMMDTADLSFSQVDIIDGLDDGISLSSSDWIETTPINQLIGHDNRGNLPAIDSSDHETYRVALGLSEIRTSFNISGDGVYCPVCHIANIGIEKLGKECPKCERPLLAFGWN